MNKDKDILIRNVPKEIKEDLFAIADNLGISVTAMVKPVLRQLRDSHPENMRTKKPY